MSATLTKKQQKALAFRSKQKAKAKGLPEPEDVPEADLEGGEGEAGEGANDDEATVATASTSTKRKRGDDDDGSEKKKDSAKGKGKKTAWDEDEEGDDKKKGKKDIKQRFILFVGNLGFKTTADEVRAHFKEAAGRIPSVRLLTDKTTGKSRGIAFVELANGTEMQACLRLHETKLNQRAINVELTAGGGGKSAARKGKIEERNKRMGGQRERRAEREKEAGGGADAEGEAEAEGAGARAPRDDAEDDANGEFKMRNGRRVRVKPKSDDGRPAKRARGDDGGRGGGRGGFGGRGGGRGGAGGGGFSRPKWTPTGANALAVG